jgi:hypothetical protein
MITYFYEKGYHISIYEIKNGVGFDFNIITKMYAFPLKLEKNSRQSEMIIEYLETKIVTLKKK